MADYSDPKRGVAYRLTLCLHARSTGQIKTAPTLAAGDVKVSKDNGATANIATLPSEAPASSGILQVDLSATEMTADLVTVTFIDAAGAEWNDVVVHIAPTTAQLADLSAKLDTIDDFIDTEVAAIKAKTDLIPAYPATETTLTTIAGYLDTEIAAILADTNELQTDWANGGRLDLILDARASQTSVDDLPTNAELATSQAAADDSTLAAIAALNNLSAAQVNAEVVDALNVDTYAEPAQGAPAATASIAAKIGNLHAAWRNKKTVTATEHQLFADDGTTVIIKSTVSDDATTFTETEKASGP